MNVIDQMFLGNLYHLLVTIILVTSKHDGTTLKYPPQVKVFCSNSSYAKEVLRSAALFDHLAIIWTSLDFQNDYYFALSYDRVSDLFLDIPTVHVLLSSKIPNLLNVITPYVPYKSIFIVSSDKSQHSYMDITRLYFDYKGIIFHLYDEQPWNEQESISHATIYQHYKFVFRSYFYKNISNKSFYLPLNSYRPKYFRNFQKNNGVVPSSRRSLWCTVTGKYSYFLNSKFHIVDADDMIAMSTMHDRIIYNNESLRHRSCQMLLNFDDSSSQTTVVTESTSDVDMAKENILGDVNSSLSPYLDQYTRILATSVFVVCIARNSYETFSHYEVGR